MKLFISWQSLRRKNTLLTILIDNRLVVTCQHNARTTSKANMIWKCIRSHVSKRDKKALVSLCFRNSTWQSGHLHSRKPNTNQWQRWISRMLQEWRTSLKGLGKKKKKKEPNYPSKTNGGTMSSLFFEDKRNLKNLDCCTWTSTTASSD